MFCRLCLTPDWAEFFFILQQLFLNCIFLDCHHHLISYHSVLKNSKVIVLCLLIQTGDVCFDCFWQCLVFHWHKNPQIYSWFSLHLACQLLAQTWIHQICPSRLPQQLPERLLWNSLGLIKPARNVIILEQAFEFFPIMAQTSIRHIKHWWQRNICCVLAALHGGLCQEEKQNSFLTKWHNFDVLQASAHFLDPFWINTLFWHHVVLSNTR